MTKWQMEAIKIASIAALIAGWQAFAFSRHNPQLFPTVDYIVGTSLPSLGVFSQTGQVGYASALFALCRHAGVTLWRIAAGFAIGAPVGLLFGLLMHWMRGSGTASALTLIVTRSIPLLALIPLFSFWFGSAGAGVVAFIGFGIFVVVSSDTYEAAANLRPALLQLGGLLGGRGLFLARTVYLPGIAAHIAGSLRNVVGLCWALSLGAEYISATSGLGYITYQSYLYTDMGKLAVMALVYMALGYVSYEITSRFIVPLLSAGTRERVYE